MSATIKRTDPPKLGLMALVDRYVPRHTQAAVLAMAALHEQEITTLLSRLHEMQHRYHELCVHLEELEDEYAKRTMVPVSYGEVSSETSLEQPMFNRTHRIMWHPDPMMTAVQLPAAPMSRDEYPHLVVACIKRFEKQLTEHLKREYGRLFDAGMQGAPPRRF